MKYLGTFVVDDAEFRSPIIRQRYKRLCPEPDSHSVLTRKFVIIICTSFAGF